MIERARRAQEIRAMMVIAEAEQELMRQLVNWNLARPDRCPTLDSLARVRWRQHAGRAARCRAELGL